MSTGFRSYDEIFDMAVDNVRDIWAAVADVLVLSSLVSGVILVSTIGRTHRQALRMFRRSLLNINAPLLGTLVNRLDVHRRFGDYSKYYKDYYHPYACADGSPETVQGCIRKWLKHACGFLLSGRRPQGGSVPREKMPGAKQPKNRVHKTQ